MTATWTPTTFDPHDPTFLADPYPVYAQFRELAPVSMVMPYRSYWAFGYDDCVRILTETDVFVKNPPGGRTAAPPPFSAIGELPQGIFASDPPRHDTLRGLVEPVFDAAIADAADIAASVSAELLGAATASSSWLEVVSDYALPMPAHVLFRLLGIDPGFPVLTQWIAAIEAAHDITSSPTTQAMGATMDMAINTLLEATVLALQQTPDPSTIIGRLVAATSPDGLSPMDVRVACQDFVIAGYLSTTYLLSTGIRSLIGNPDQAALLRASPELIPGAVEEMLRYDAPFQIVDRFAARPTELSGVSLAVGDAVSAIVGSANRDGARFADADEFVATRTDNPHLGFGDGIHHCIGAPLARLVAPVAVGALLDLGPMTIQGIPQWHTDPYLRGCTSLLVSLP
jgi:cytochrome P450